jgi:hypothetical protein
MRTHRFLPLVLLSALAALTSATAQLQLQPLWSVAPGTQPYMTTGNTERGMAMNPTTGHILVVSRAGASSNSLGAGIVILDPSNGSQLGTLNVTGIPTTAAGTFPINMIGVGDDGAIYLGNLTLNGSTDPFRLYRWANESAAPVQVFSGNPTGALGGTDRWGDTLTVRGSGNDTQVLIASRNGTTAAVLVTGDGGATFSAVPMTTDVAAGDIGLGLTVGSGDTFWGTAGGRSLRHISVDATGVPLVGNTVGNFGATEGIPTSLTALGSDPAAGLLAGMDLLTGPDVLRLYDVSTGTPLLLDSETLPVDNANANGTGAIGFYGGNVYFLDSNNGLYAFALIPEPGTIALGVVGGLALLAYRRRK